MTLVYLDLILENTSVGTHSHNVIIMNMITTSLFCQLMAAFQQAGCCEDCKNVYMINWTFSQKKKINSEASHSI